MTESTDQSRRPRLSSDALSIVVTVITVGLTILGTLVYTTARLEDRLGARIDDVQAQARADQAAWQAESRQLRDEARAAREAWQAESRQLRDEARAAREADREAAQADREAAQAARDADREHFQREILRLASEQAELSALMGPEQ